MWFLMSFTLLSDDSLGFLIISKGSVLFLRFLRALLFLPKRLELLPGLNGYLVFFFILGT